MEYRLRAVIRVFRVISAIVLLCVIGLSSGCSNKLATGYKPRLLGDSEVRRRAYYSDQFSTQAKAAEQEKQTEDTQRRPGVSY